MKLVEMRKLLVEGGSAAERLLPQLQQAYGKPLTYTKISQKDLGTVFDTAVREILDALKINNIIAKDYQPKYTLGSTRLAADIAGKPVSRYSHEDDPVRAKASMAKQEFGDLDIDIELLPQKTMKDVASVISQIEPARMAVKDAGIEANIAVRVGDKVIQIDVVNVGDDRQSMEFRQSSSYTDMAQNIKGMIQSLFLSSIVKTLPFDQDDKIKLADVIKNHPDVQKWTSKGYRLVNMGRYLLGPKGLRVVIDMEKDGIKGRKTIDLEDKDRVSTQDLNKLAKVVLQDNSATVDTLVSAVKMAEFMHQRHPDRVQDVWNMFVTGCANIVNDGKMSDKDAANALQVIGTHLGIPTEEIAKAVKG